MSSANRGGVSVEEIVELVCCLRNLSDSIDRAKEPNIRQLLISSAAGVYLELNSRLPRAQAAAEIVPLERKQ